MLINKDYTWSQDSLREVYERIKERNDQMQEKPPNDFNDGMKAAFYIVMDMIKNDLEGRGYDLEKFMSGEQE